MKRVAERLMPKKVELGVVDDLTDGYKYLDKQNAAIEKKIGPIKADFTALRKKVNNIKEMSMGAMAGVKQGDANITRIEKQLKDLGIAANSIPVIANFKKAVTDAENNRKIVQGIPDIPNL